MYSIIICTYNRSKYIYQTLEKIAQNEFSTSNYEIILVNNNSTDSTEEECFRFKNTYSNIPFKYFVETNQGLSHARNRGMKEASGEWFIFLDDDAFVYKNYLSNLDKNLQQNADAIAFGGKITPHFESGTTPQWMSKWSYSWVSAIDMSKDVTLFKSKAYPIGANMGFRSSCMDSYGLFNTELGRTKDNLLGGEEKDYFNRIKAANGLIYYFPDIEVQHMIPEKRTTKDFIQKLAFGIGISEQKRTKAISNFSYTKRLLSELIKWAATIILLCLYGLKFQLAKGTILIYFRYFVTKGLVMN